MLSPPEQQNEILSLVEVGRISPIHQIIEELDINIDCDYIYEQYIKKHNPRCMFCGNNVIKVDYSIIRHLDCTNKDWMVNCRCYFFLMVVILII